MFAVADNCGPTYVSVPLLTYGDRLIQTPIFVGRPAVVYRRGDPDIYCLVGLDVCTAGVPFVGRGNAVDFISKWLVAHPHATVTPISVESKKMFSARPPVHSRHTTSSGAGGL